jgi:hypothetical protein
MPRVSSQTVPIISTILFQLLKFMMVVAFLGSVGSTSSTNYFNPSAPKFERLQWFLSAWRCQGCTWNSSVAFYCILCSQISGPWEFFPSDNMQVQNLRKYQGSKSFVEGRLKLSTACTECHKRKQKVCPWNRLTALRNFWATRKCNQQQPCQHCSRRYPPPQCIYRRKMWVIQYLFQSTND